MDYGDPNNFYALKQESGSVSSAVDASRYIGTLEKDECRTEYWLVSYPRKALIGGNWVDVTGGVKADDDLWLPYDFWVASSGGTTYEHRYVTMRNEISAMANKIWPNGDNKVPDQYVQAIADVLGWDTLVPGGGTTAYPGQTVKSQGIWYDFGNVGAGFDNNYDFTPDRNAWVQPIGDASNFDPGCFRLVRTYGLVIVKLNDGTELLIPFVDQMYFENIPENNTGAVGLVYYEYVALDGACTAGLTPYQEVASGFDNEKFNADFGAGIPPLQSQETIMEFDKTAAPTVVTPNAEITYTIAYENVDPDDSGPMTVTVGDPEVGMPFTVQDSIPAGTCYTIGSATANTGNNLLVDGTYNSTAYLVMYSADTNTLDGITGWQTAEPTDPDLTTATCNEAVTHLRWMRTGVVANDSTGQVQFKVLVPTDYVIDMDTPAVENTGCAKLGEGPCFADSTTITPVTGNRALSGYVYLDNGVGSGGKANGVKDGTEGGINTVTVKLYYDADENGVYSAGDIYYGETASNSSGFYQFTNLPSARFVVKVDLTDSDLNGYALTSKEELGADLTSADSTDNNFGFISTPEITKSLPANVSSLYRGQQVTYTIAVTNPIPGSGTASNACLYTAYATSEGPETSGLGSGFRFNNIYPTPNTINTSNAFSTLEFDGAFVSADYTTGGNKEIAGTGYSTYLASLQPSATGITSIKARFNLFLNKYFKDGSEDSIDVKIIRGTAESAVVNIPYTTLEQYVGHDEAGIVEVDLTAVADAIYTPALDFGFFSETVQLVFMTKKTSSGNDGVTIAVDGLGLKVTADTADVTCPVTDSKVLNPVRVTDTFDNTLLEAGTITSVPPFNTKATGSPTTETILTWDNVGPIYPGQTQYIYVTGTVLDPDPSPENLVNEAEITNAWFADGRLASDPGPVSVTKPVYDAGTLSGKVWRDGDQDGWQGTTGYESGESGIEGVLVSLYQCVHPTTGAPVMAAVTGQKCTEYVISPGVTAIWAVIDATYTDVNGDYSFGGLNGYYYVKLETNTGPLLNMTGYADVNDKVGTCGNACDGLSNEDIDLDDSAFLGRIITGNNVTNLNFGYGTLGAYGYLYHDYDGDGTHTSTEDYPLKNVPVTIYKNSTCTGGSLATTTTDLNGYYFFTNLTSTSTPTAYCLQVGTLPGSGWTSVPTYDPNEAGSPNLSTYVFTVPITKDLTNYLFGNYDFSYTKPFSYTIGDQVYYDWDGDGAFTSGVDEPISGVTLELYYDVDGDGKRDAEDLLVATDISTTSGYLFDSSNTSNGQNLPAGSYLVVVADFPAEIEDDLAQTADPDESGACSTCDHQSDVTLVDDGDPATNDNNYLQDFGYQPARFGTIGDTVFFDKNADGTQLGVQEVGIAGVIVELWVDLNNDGTYLKVDEETTDAAGKYLFSNVPLFDDGDMDEDTYQVRLYYQSDLNTLNEGTNRTAIEAYFDGDSTTVDFVTSLGTDQPTYIYWNATDLHTGSTSFLGADYGFGPLGTFGDTIYWDANANGTQDYKEAGVPGVTVTLKTFTDAGNNNGAYTAGEGYLDIDDNDSYSVADTYTDSNSNGKWDVGETLLTDTDNDEVWDPAEPFYDTQDGRYQPGELILSTYATTVTSYRVIDGKIDIDNDGDVDANDNGSTAGCTIAAGVITNYASGCSIYSGFPVINGYVDADRDGTTNPDLGDDLQPGFYIFAGLPAGNYLAEVTTASGPLSNATLTADPDTDGIPCGNLNSPADLYEMDSHFCDDRMGMQVFPGTTFLGADFGYQPSGVFGDTLWIDSDSDGARDPGEAGIPEITVTASTTVPAGATVNGILYAVATLINLTAKTDVNGNYIFQNVTTDVQLTWTVAVTTGQLPSGLANTYDPDGGTANQAQLVMAADGSILSIGTCEADDYPNGCDGESDPLKLDLDFGYRYSGSLDISGTLCLETSSSDGFCGAVQTVPDLNPSDDYPDTTTGEVPYDGVTVYLLRWTDAGSVPNGTPDPGETVLVASTTTDANGNYLFDSVPQATSADIYYIVAINSPQDGVALTTDAQNGTTDVPEEAVDAYPVVSNNAFLGVASAADGDTLSVFMVVEAEPGDTTIDGVDFAFELNGTYDFGDLPQGLVGSTNYEYSTTLQGTPDGARHEQPSGGYTHYLGTAPDGETNGFTANLFATGDDYNGASDEDGMALILSADENADGWYDGAGTLRFDVNITTPGETGWLIGWIDYNRDGDFNEPNEMVLSQEVSDTGGFVDFPITTPTAPFPAGDFFARFRLFVSRPVAPALAYAGSAVDGEVEDYLITGITTPITVSYFRAQRRGETVNFEWTTSTETSNAGFNLYVETAENSLVQVNDELILSQVIDSVEAQDYTFSTEVEGNTFFIEDVSLAGETRQHGPFQLGRPYGGKPEAEKIDWAAIQAEHNEKYAERQAKLKQELSLPASALEPVAKQGKSVKPVKTLAPTATPEPATTGNLLGRSPEKTEKPSKPEKTEKPGKPGKPTATPMPTATALPSEEPTATKEPTATVTADPTVTLEPTPTIVATEIPATAISYNPYDLQLTNTFNLKVNKTGLYRVTYEMLQTAGLDLAGVPVEKLTVLNRDKLIPIYVYMPEQAEALGAGGYLEFYGEALDTLYTDTNIYTVQVTKGLAPRMREVNAAPGDGSAVGSYVETLRINNQKVYSASAPGIEPWYEASLRVAQTSNSWNYSVTVQGLADAALSADMEMYVMGMSNNASVSPDHHLLVSMNGTVLANETFDGVGGRWVRMRVPGGLLREGVNTLQITLPGDTGAALDVIALDQYLIHYARKFQMQNGKLSFSAAGEKFSVTGLPDNNVSVYRLSADGSAKLNGVQVTAESGSYTAVFAGTAEPDMYMVTSAGTVNVPELEAVRMKVDLNHLADYLIITHPDFIGGLQPLVSAKQAQGLSVSVVDVKDVYAQYGYSIFDPSAIKAYISYAVQNLGVKYVLLVGGDTYDYRNYLGNSISFIPSLYAVTGSLTNFNPADPMYGDVNGDNLSDVAIGRFPVRTSAELGMLVNKTLAYGNKMYGKTAVFASDKQDGALSFKAVSLALMSGLGGDWMKTGLHLDDLSVSVAKTNLLSAMNNGTALVTYVGHSGTTSWTSSGLFNNKDAAGLTNAGKPFVVVEWGCWNTYYVHPTSVNLVQSLMLSGDKGAAVVLGATSLAEAESEELLGRLLLPRLVTPGMTVGEALREAKLELAQTHPEMLDVLLGFTLMGDPATIIQP